MNHNGKAKGTIYIQKDLRELLRAARKKRALGAYWYAWAGFALAGIVVYLVKPILEALL